MEVVHVGNGHIATSSDVVIRHQDRSHGTQEDSVATEESEEFLCRRKDLPWNTGPCTNESSEDLTAANVDVLRAEGHEIVGCADGVGGDVDTESNDQQTDSGKCSSSAASMRTACLPVVDDLDWIPFDPIACWLSSGSGENAEKTDDGEDEGDDKGLDVLRGWLFGIPREIGNVETKSGVVAED